MANNTPITLYWDANIFIDYIQQNPTNISAITSVIAEMRALPGSRIYTSIFTTVEVSHVAHEREKAKLDPKAEEYLDRMWADRSLITIVEMNPEIARLSRWLIRSATTRSWSLKGKDAIHLGTAYWLAQNGIPLNHIHTCDDRLHKYNALLGVSIGIPSPRQFTLDLIN